MLTDWSKITISQYTEICDLKYINIDDYNINILSVLLNISVSKVENYTIKEFESLLLKTNFINTPPTVKAKQTLKIDDSITFHRIVFESITVGEFIDIEYLLKDVSANYTTLQTIFYRQKTLENSKLFIDEYEEYGNWIYHRAPLFEEIKVIDVYSTLVEYLTFRDLIFKNYEGLFNDPEPEKEIIEEEIENETIDKKEETIREKKERLAEERESDSKKKWGWDTMILKLGGGNPLKLEEATSLPLILALNSLSIKKELNLE